MDIKIPEIKPDTKVTSNKSTTEEESKVSPAKVTAFDEDLDQEYIDKRSVTIALVHNYSAYRKANLKVLGQRVETIGSSIQSSRILSSNAEEVNTYFPALIGLSPTNPEFITRVKAWLSNIHFVISEGDAKLNTTFIYRHKSDYLKIKEQEDKINAIYDKVDRANTANIREALKQKINSLNTLESTKYKYGRPENLEDYLMYRHCLVYRDVAKDTALINSDPTLRFYIKDEAREAEKQRKLTDEKVKAMRNFVELSSNDAKLHAVYIAICVQKNDVITNALLRDKNEKSAVIMDYVNTNPDKFNRLVNDKNVELKAFIETLIARGELVRSEYNQQISTADGAFIGANINEAIAWFENPNNKDVRAAFENKLKLS